MYYCYLIENLINGHLYVGKSINVKARWAAHKRVASGGKKKYPKEFQIIHQAIAKYGIDNFSIVVINECDTEQQAFNNEIDNIAKLKSDGHILYNQTNGGEGASGHKMSDEQKQKLILTNIGNTYFLGRHHTDDTKRKMSLSQMGNTHGLGRVFSDETRAKISLSHMGMKYAEEIKQKVRLARLGTTATKETKEKMSLAHQGENNIRSKLTWKEVNQIRELHSQGTSQAELTKKFNVHKGTISKICLNKTWKA